MRVLVATVVHHPLDARVYTREIGALVEAGHAVTYAAPWSAFGVEPPAGITPVDLPRAHGRRRLTALGAARRVLRRDGPGHDLVLLHNPELILAVAGTEARHKTVLDLHEDLAGALVDKAYLPRVARRPMAAGVRVAERWAEKHLHLILAEYGYQSRFRRPHPVVPNEPVVPDSVPPPGTDRVVYLGRVSDGRGLHEMLALAPRLPEATRLEILGWGDDDAVPLLEAAATQSRIGWTGRIDNDLALAQVEGAVAGLSLLHDLPNYRHSRPTKVVEYMARGVPVITTPLPVAVEIVERHRCGIVVPFGDPGAVADAVHDLATDRDKREEMGRRGHRAAVDGFNWARSGPRFVETLEDWAAR